MTTTAQAVDPRTAALESARALARAIGDSDPFRVFEIAEEALEADATLLQRLAAFHVRDQELRLARTWGGADPEAVVALEREWESLSSQPAFAAHLRAREDLLAVLREVVAAISEGIEVDFGEACAPAGGCC